MGVRRGDDALLSELESFLERRRPEIERLLDDYGVPRVGRDEGGGARDGKGAAAR
jgi:hypothetical protein